VPAHDVGTTEFDLSDEKKRLLIDGGRRAAEEFLDKFDPDDYRNTYGHGFDVP
jgi:hypothetical protein